MRAMERLLAERECERLTYRYCQAADFGHASRLADLFTGDGVFDNRDLRLHGRDEIRRVFSEREKVRELRTRHVCTNVLVDVLDADRATGVVYLCLYRRRGPLDWSVPVASTLPVLVGSYHDEYAREDGRWLIASRLQQAPFQDPSDPSWTPASDH